jgi:hypothetical protein
MVRPAGARVAWQDSPPVGDGEHAIEIDRYGGPQELVWRAVRRAPPGPGEIRVRTRFAGGGSGCDLGGLRPDCGSACDLWGGAGLRFGV